MRVALIVPALFALSLVGGTALAEKPEHQHPAKEPRTEISRTRGDIVDRYDHGTTASARATERVTDASQPSARLPEKLDAPRTHGDIVDHAYQGASTVTKSSSQRFDSQLPYTHTPQPTQRQAERQNCSTAQDDCSANRKNRFGGTTTAHLEKKTKDGAATYAWRGDRSGKSDPKSSSGGAVVQLSPAQQQVLIKILKAKMCAHAASQDGCGGGAD
jgi:hypothetical protein